MEVSNGIAMGYPVANFPWTKRYGHAAVDHHDNEAQELGANSVCGFVCAALLVLFVGFVVILLMMNYGKDPPEFRVDSVSVTPLNLSAENPLLAANWKVDFFVRNPSSGEGYYYSRAEASVLYGQFTLASASIIPFTHDVEDQRNLQVSMAAASVPIAGELVAEWRSGWVDVTVAVDCLVRVIDRESSGQGQPQHMRVSCDGVEVGFSPNATVGRLIGGPTPCRVHLKSPSFGF